MHRVIDIAPFNGIIMNVFDFLQHHLITLDLLRMRTFFPNLIFAIFFMRLFIESQLPEYPFSALRFKHFKQAFGSPGFKTADFRR